MTVAFIIVLVIAVIEAVILVWGKGKLPPPGHVVIPPPPPGANTDPGDLTDGGQAGDYPPDPGPLPDYTP